MSGDPHLVRTYTAKKNIRRPEAGAYISDGFLRLDWSGTGLIAMFFKLLKHLLTQGLLIAKVKFCVADCRLFFQSHNGCGQITDNLDRRDVAAINLGRNEI